MLTVVNVLTLVEGVFINVVTLVTWAFKSWEASALESVLIPSSILFSISNLSSILSNKWDFLCTIRKEPHVSPSSFAYDITRSSHFSTICFNVSKSLGNCVVLLDFADFFNCDKAFLVAFASLSLHVAFLALIINDNSFIKTSLFSIWLSQTLSISVFFLVNQSKNPPPLIFFSTFIKIII